MARDSRTGAQRLVSYLVRITPPGNVRVSTRFRFTQLSSAVKNGVPPPTRTGAVTSTYSSISRSHAYRPARRGKLIGARSELACSPRARWLSHRLIVPPRKWHRSETDLG